MWDLNTGEELMSLSGHKRDVVAVRYCKLTKILYSVSQNIIKVGIDTQTLTLSFEESPRVVWSVASLLMLIISFNHPVMGFTARVR